MSVLAREPSPIQSELCRPLAYAPDRTVLSQTMTSDRQVFYLALTGGPIPPRPSVVASLRPLRTSTPPRPVYTPLARHTLSAAIWHRAERDQARSSVCADEGLFAPFQPVYEAFALV